MFDNATDPDALQPYLPAVGGARVLITSNRQSVAELGELLGVEVFTPDEAVAFLTERTRLADTEGARELACELGFLPLALAQAAAVIRTQRLAYAIYLERLRALTVADYLIRGPGQPYPHGVAEAVLLSLQVVQAGDPSGTCVAVMELTSVLSAAGVRRDMLHAAGQAGAMSKSGTTLDAAEVDQALGRLAEGSLLAFSVDGHAVTAHRLVQRVVSEHLAQQGRLAAVCQAAANALHARAHALDGSPDRPAVRDVPEQVAALQQTAAGLPGKTGGLETDVLHMRFLAMYHLNRLGDSARQAIAVGESFVEDQKRLVGFDHPDTLASQNSLANAYQQAGRPAEAAALHKRTLADRERLQGPDHPDTVSSRNNVANTYQIAGRTAEAIALHERTLADMERQLGPDDLDTIGSRSNLANSYQEAGMAAAAIPLHKCTVADLERLLGENDPRTLTAMGNLANAYQEAGKTASAIALQQRTLAALEHLLGPDQPGTLVSRHNLATSYLYARDLTRAIALLESTLADQERILGDEHPDTLSSRNNLAEAYLAAGRAADAIPLHERTLPALERWLGPDHPRTLTSRANLAKARHDERAE